jgi:hypothetical protein
MAECAQSSFQFPAHFSRDVTARFDGGTMTSDAGALLLRETDRRLISHPVPEPAAQRVYALTLGYQDRSDHEQPREDPLLAVLSGKRRTGAEPLAGKCTLNRLELGGEEPAFDVYVSDKHKLELEMDFSRENPHARQMLAARLLEVGRGSTAFPTPTGWRWCGLCTIVESRRGPPLRHQPELKPERGPGRSGDALPAAGEVRTFSISGPGAE